MTKKKNAVIIVLILLLVVVGGYVALDLFNTYQSEQQLSVYQQGAVAGYEQAIVPVIQQASSCQQVPLYVGNQSVNIVAVDCLRS